jgi:hypothetical protein
MVREDGDPHLNDALLLVAKEFEQEAAKMEAAGSKGRSPSRSPHVRRVSCAATATIEPPGRSCEMTKLDEIEGWRNKAIHYRDLAAQAETEASRIMLEGLAREADEIANGIIAGLGPGPVGDSLERDDPRTKRE